MNFYDKINELVKFFKETEEYKEFICLKTKIKYRYGKVTLTGLEQNT